jgi:outer membrane protein assembly factor BamD (BamD/ComL family)
LTKTSISSDRFLPIALALLFAAAPLALSQESFELKPGGFEKVAEPDPASAEGQLLRVRKLIATDNPYDAADEAKRWIADHPNHPLLPDAHLLRGDALAAATEHYKALFEYELVIRTYPESPQFAVALDREMRIADTFASGVKRKLWGMRVLPAAGEAEELYIRTQERAPGSKIAERAGLALADFYYSRSEMDLAAEAYELFLRNFPKTQWREHALQRQVLANLATFKGPQFDATGLIEAQRRLGDFKTNFPAAAEQVGADSILTRVDESLATRSLLTAEYYDTSGKKVSASFMYQRVIKDHPGSVAAQKALDHLRQIDPKRYGDVPVPAQGQEKPATPPATVIESTAPVKGPGKPGEKPADSKSIDPPAPNTDKPAPPGRTEKPKP